VLGPVRAWAGEREVLLGPARRRTLFAVLAAHANRIVSRDELIEAIWGTSAPATANGNIYTYVSGLRRSLEPDRSRWSTADVLSSRSSGYTLRLADDALDADRFRDLRAVAAELAARGATTAAIARLDEALALWHGEAYAGLAGQFVELDRQRLADLRLSTVEQRARLILASGYDDGLVAELTASVREAPLRESLHELLMLALHRAGRDAEALDAFRAGRRTLVTELGVEPGEAMRSLHRRILEGSADDAAPVQGGAASTPPAPVIPAQPAPVIPAQPAHVIPAQPTQVIAAPPGPGDGRQHVGRRVETALLRDLVRGVARGRGATVWVEGEPGIGKSELLAVAVGDATELGCRLAWGVADELGRRVPFQVITKALGLPPAPADTPLPGDPTAEEEPGTGATVERVLAYVRGACAGAPLVLVVDDLHCADEASLLVWERLVALTRRLPLLLVTATRPEPNGRELARLRRGVQARGGHVVVLPPLPETDVEELFAIALGARAGASLRPLAARTAGNPMYAREMVDGLVRRQGVRVANGIAEVDPAVAAEVPRSLIAAVRATLDFLSDDTREVLRFAALLGVGFAVSDVAAVTEREPYDLMASLDEAVAANVVVDAGAELAFRHPFLRQALIESIPTATRRTLHRHAAEALAQAGGSALRVAEQLVAEPPLLDKWLIDWLVANRDEIVRRAPQIAGDLLRSALDSGLPGPDQRESLLIALVRLDFRRESYPVAAAREAMELARNPGDRAEMRLLLAAMRYRQGEPRDAIALLDDAVADPAVPEIWRTRHRVLLANFRRGSLDDLDRAERTARQVFAEATVARSPYEAAFAQQTLWLTGSIQRDHERALRHIDLALNLAWDRPELTGMCFDLLDNKTFSLQNLDRLDEADRTLASAATFAARHDMPASLQVATAVQAYWRGRWDDALAQVSAVTDDAPGITFHGMREPGAARMLLHGVAALIAGRRGMHDATTGHLTAAEAVPGTDSERENCDFLIVAQALVAERQDRPADALAHFVPLLQPAYAPMMLRHQWLPDVIRLALSADRRDAAERAMEICTQEAAREVYPARAYAADARCRALMTGDPEPARRAVDHYRRVGRAPELAAALEDAAVLLAARDRTDDAVTAGREALRLYGSMGANWDDARARRRMAAHGVPDVRTC
jgi:DNA-binding SARP family transcriptional activator/tetratricopeptide (TPR) repeat protein